MGPAAVKGRLFHFLLGLWQNGSRGVALEVAAAHSKPTSAHLMPPKSLNRRCRPKMLNSGMASAVAFRPNVSTFQFDGGKKGRGHLPVVRPLRPARASNSREAHAWNQQHSAISSPAPAASLLRTRQQLQHECIAQVAQQGAQHAGHGGAGSHARHKAGALLHGEGRMDRYNCWQACMRAFAEKTACCMTHAGASPGWRASVKGGRHGATPQVCMVGRLAPVMLMAAVLLAACASTKPLIQTAHVLCTQAPTCLEVHDELLNVRAVGRAARLLAGSPVQLSAGRQQGRRLCGNDLRVWQ